MHASPIRANKFFCCPYTWVVLLNEARLSTNWKLKHATECNVIAGRKLNCSALKHKTDTRISSVKYIGVSGAKGEALYFLHGEFVSAFELCIKFTLRNKRISCVCSERMLNGLSHCWPFYLLLFFLFVLFKIRREPSDDKMQCKTSDGNETRWSILEHMHNKREKWREANFNCQFHYQCCGMWNDGAMTETFEKPLILIQYTRFGNKFESCFLFCFW